MIQESRETQTLGIDLASKGEPQLFRWFLACLLFGKPVQRSVARQAYRELTSAGIDSIITLAEYDWSEIVALLDRAHYVRYDYSTATKLIEVATLVRTRYGSITALLNGAKNRAELERKLLDIKWIGPKTTEIFMQSIIASGLK